MTVVRSVSHNFYLQAYFSRLHKLATRTNRYLFPLRNPAFLLRRIDNKTRMSTSSTTPKTTGNGPSSSLANDTIAEFCKVLSSKQPTPGGGASAAIGAAIGAATASMSASYTQRKKDEESGAADSARKMISDMDIASLLSMADDDVSA